MNDCAKYRDALSAYVDGELRADEAAELENHIANCEECARLLEEYREVAALFTAEEDPPADLVQNVMSGVTKVKRARTVSFVTKRVLPVATCLVLAVGAVRLLPRMGNSAVQNAAGYDSANFAPEMESTTSNTGGLLSDEYKNYSSDTGTVTVQTASDEYAEDDAVNDVVDEAQSEPRAGCDFTDQPVNAEAIVYINIGNSDFSSLFSAEDGFPADFLNAFLSSDFSYDEPSGVSSAVISADNYEPLLEALEGIGVKYSVSSHDEGSGLIIVALVP